MKEREKEERKKERMRERKKETNVTPHYNDKSCKTKRQEPSHFLREQKEFFSKNKKFDFFIHFESLNLITFFLQYLLLE